MGASFPLTFDAVFEPQAVWWIDGDPIPRQTSETATDRTLTLSWRVTTAKLESVLRPLKPDEGKVDTIGTDDGGYRSVDRAGGDNTYTLDPPDPRAPLRQATTTWHVNRYEEALISQAVGEWEVEIEFVRAENRTDTPSLSQSPATDEWGITTRNGTIATGRVDADVLGTGEGAVERFEIETRLTFEQAHVFEAALARLGAARIRTIPDAPNVAVDDSTTDAATVTLDTPDSQTVVSDGDYLVTDWDSERITDAYQRVSMTVAALG